jgi:hypothetical protein
VQSCLVWEHYHAAIASAEVANFMHRRVLARYGYYDERLDYAMDYAYGLELLLDGVRPLVLDRVLGKARLHEASKTVSMGPDGHFRREQYRVLERALPRLPEADRPVVRRGLERGRFFGLLGRLIRATHRSKAARLAELAAALARTPRLLLSRATLGGVRRILVS